MTSVALNNAYDPNFDRVADAYLKGKKNPTVIAKELGLKRAEVITYIDELKAIARNDNDVRERAKEALQEADAALNLVIERLWETVEQADAVKDLKTKASTLKSITDAQVKIVETLQKAGLYDDAAMGDELAEAEEKRDILISILKDVSLKCDNCKTEVARRLMKVTNQAEPMVADNNVYEGEVIPPA